jgi:hypothetical protein
MRTWTCVWVDDCDAFLACAVLEETFLSAIVARAGESCKIEENGHFVCRVLDCLWGEVKVQSHFTAGGGGIVSEFQKLATKGSNRCSCFKRHLDLQLGVQMM